MAWSAMVTLRIPEAHTLFIVSEGISQGSPALTVAWREGICPLPPCNTIPMMMLSMELSSIPDLLMASLSTIPPSSMALRDDSPPPSLPKGVLAKLKITDLLT